MSGQSEDIFAIKRLAADWRSGWLAGDADLLLSLYGDDPVVTPQDRPVVIGRDAIRAIYQSVLKEFDFKSESRLMEERKGSSAPSCSSPWIAFWPMSGTPVFAPQLRYSTYLPALGTGSRPCDSLRDSSAYRCSLSVRLS